MSFLYMFRQLWRYAGKEQWKIPVYMLAHACSLSGVLVQPYAFAQVFNVLQRNEPERFSQILGWVGVYLLGFFIFETFHRIGRFLERRVAFRARQHFVRDMYARLHHLPMQWHADHHSGNVINRIMVASEGLSEFGQNQDNYVGDFMQFVGPLVILAGISYEIALIAITLLLLTTLIIARFDRRLVSIVRAQNEALHHFSATFFDYVSNMKTILTLRLGQPTEQELDRTFQRFFPELMRELYWNQTKCFIVSVCILLLEAGIIVFYIWRQEARHLPLMIGTIAAMFQYLRQLSNAYSRIAGTYNDIMRWKTDFQAVQPILDAFEQRHVLDEPHIPAWNHINITGLTFTYNGGPPVLQDVSLNLTPTAKIALVGESGSGKSTILHVLRGLYGAPIARLHINDREYRGVAVLSGMTTLVPQDPEIFENTLLYNISVGLQVSPQAVTAALDMARFTPVLSRMPAGLATDIREKGVNLSGGEKQRLALTRGLLAARSSAILLLDEPTSSVDAHNEMLIYDQIFRDYHGKCIISSVHRLHLLDRFDMVYVLEQGRIVQSGTFQELRSQTGGVFANLWQTYQRESREEQ